VSGLRIILAATLAVVLMTAAIGKPLSKPTPGDLALGALDALLATGIAPVLGALACLAVTGAYATHALTRRPGQRCACFGSHLPRTSVGGQRARNLTLLAVVTGYSAITLAGHGEAAGHLAIDLALAVVLSTAIVAGPWLAEWLCPSLPTRK
jgi:hypothetical protein